MFNYDQCPNSSTKNYFQGYRLPDFVIIGTQKGGTTACRNNLALHKDIAIYPYEVHFFDDHFKNGPRWYSKLFRRFQSNLTLWGERSPSYLFVHEVAAQMRRMMPHAKIIVLLREPTARAFSAYRHFTIDARENRTFAHAIRDELRELDARHILNVSSPIGLWNMSRTPQRQFSYIERGFYQVQLDHWLQYFPRCQILIAISERLLAEETRNLEMNRIFRFLGVGINSSLHFGKAHMFESKIPKNNPVVDWAWNSPDVNE